MTNFDSSLENKERLKLSILAIESNPSMAAMYKSWFMKTMGVPVEIIPAGNALVQKRDNVSMLIVEPPINDEIGNYILKLRNIYPNQHIVVASERDDILSEIKDPKIFPNVSALTKPFHMEELGELVNALSSKDWKKKISIEKPRDLN